MKNHVTRMSEIHRYFIPCWVVFTLSILLADMSQADEYSIIISTADNSQSWEGTEDAVRIDIDGNEGTIPGFQLVKPIGRSSNEFAAGTSNWYEVTKPDVGMICRVRLTLGGDDGWLIHMVSVTNKNTSHGAVLLFSKTIDDGKTATRNLPVDGGWGMWSKWSVCKGSCGTDGTRFRVRSCDTPKPGCSGRDCVGEKREKRKCGMKPCSTIASTTSGVGSSESADTYHAISTEGIVTCTNCDKSGMISIGVVLALSIVLNIILALFLFVVLRNMYSDRKDSQDQRQPKR